MRFRTFATSPERERGVGAEIPSLALGAGFEIGSSMAGFAWLAVRQAQEAMKHGRLEEALRLLNQPHAQEHRNAAALTTKLARAFVVRAERSLRKDDAEAAWRDLLEAEHLQTAEKNAERLREALTRLGVAEMRALLQAGEPGRAEEAAARLRGKLVRTPELQVLEDAARGWLAAPRPGGPRRVRSGAGGGGPGDADWCAARGPGGISQGPGPAAADVRRLAGAAARGGQRRPRGRRDPRGRSRCWPSPRSTRRPARCAARPGRRSSRRRWRSAELRGTVPRTTARAAELAGSLPAVDRRRRRLSGLPRDAGQLRPGAYPVRLWTCRWWPTCRGCTPR